MLHLHNVCPAGRVCIIRRIVQPLGEDEGQQQGQQA